MSFVGDYIPEIPYKYRDMHGKPVKSFHLNKDDLGILYQANKIDISLENRLAEKVKAKYDVSESMRRIIVTKLMFGDKLKYSEETEKYLEKIL